VPTTRIVLSLSLFASACNALSDDSVRSSGGKADAVCQQSCDSPTVVGKYDLRSTFELAGDLPEALPYAPLNALLDDPHDPATWLLDVIQNNVSSPVVVDMLATARVLFELDAWLHDYLIAHEPDLIVGLMHVREDLERIVDAPGLRSELTIGLDVGDGPGQHQLTGAIFPHHGEVVEVSAAQVDWPPAAAGLVDIAIERDQLYIRRHTLELPYGKLMQFTLRNLIVPAHEPFASSLRSLVAGWLDCGTMSEALAAQFDSQFESVLGAAFEGGCIIGVDIEMIRIEDDFIEAEEVTADVTVAGSSRLVADDCGCQVTGLEDGEWEGGLVFGRNRVLLPRPDQTFAGTRQ
jgi:hypothetical protein